MKRYKLLCMESPEEFATAHYFVTPEPMELCARGCIEENEYPLIIPLELDTESPPPTIARFYPIPSIPTDMLRAPVYHALELKEFQESIDLACDILIVEFRMTAGGMAYATANPARLTGEIKAYYGNPYANGYKDHEIAVKIALDSTRYCAPTALLTHELVSAVVDHAYRRISMSKAPREIPGGAGRIFVRQIV